MRHWVNFNRSLRLTSRVCIGLFLGLAQIAAAQEEKAASGPSVGEGRDQTEYRLSGTMLEIHWKNNSDGNDEDWPEAAIDWVVEKLHKNGFAVVLMPATLEDFSSRLKRRENDPFAQALFRHLSKNDTGATYDRKAVEEMFSTNAHRRDKLSYYTPWGKSFLEGPTLIGPVPTKTLPRLEITITWSTQRYQGRFPMHLTGAEISAKVLDGSQVIARRVIKPVWLKSVHHTDAVVRPALMDLVKFVAQLRTSASPGAGGEDRATSRALGSEPE
ncbi:MAG: hypothetical protein GMKNLPBB_01409 [Myxococcota bacterium]|nr:hypothetical protein [Myxococcota bacterium]